VEQRSSQPPNRVGVRERPPAAYWHPLGAEDVAALFDRLTDGIAVIGTDWRCRYINEPGAAMFGRTPGELLGSNIWAQLPDALGRPFHLAYERAFREQRPVTVSEYEDTLGRWFENRVYPRGDELVIVFGDITDQHVAKEELEDYADRMEQAERIARFGVWKWDVATGRVRWSAELHRIYGLTPGEFGGTVEDFLSFVMPEDRELVHFNIGKAVDTHEPFVFEERIRRADGNERVLLSQGRVIEGAKGEVAALVGICHDVTDRADAERFGLIQDIDVWMVEQALRVAPDLKPEVNLSGISLCDPVARHRIVGLLRAQPELARRLVFEITETATVEHLEAAEEFAAELTELGCGLALDDFGTGFGSFTYLRRLPLRYLKIDRSFVSNLPRSADDRRVVQSIIGIAERFGLRTIAEGVEDEATLELVRQLGADYAQGFHLGRPAPLELRSFATAS
jgi:PAS domain S-box-containing protein